MLIHMCTAAQFAESLSFGVHLSMCFHCEQGKGIHGTCFSCGMWLLMAVRKNQPLVTRHFLA